MRERAAEFFEAHVFAGDGLDHIRARHEHVARLVDHDDEVRERRRVHGATGRRPHDDRDLGDDTGCGRVAAKDLAVFAEGDDAFLDARTAGVEDTDHRNAGLECVVHDLDDLLARDLAERAAEDGEVLAEDGHVAAVDRADTCDHRVAVRPLVLHAEGMRAMAHEFIELDERALVEQQVDALAGGHLAFGVLLLDRGQTAGGHGFVVAVLEVGEFACRGREVGAWFGVGHAVHSTGQRMGHAVEEYLQNRLVSLVGLQQT